MNLWSLACSLPKSEEGEPPVPHQMTLCGAGVQLRVWRTPCAYSIRLGWSGISLSGVRDNVFTVFVEPQSRVTLVSKEESRMHKCVGERPP